MTCDEYGRLSVWNLSDGFLLSKTKKPKPPLYRPWGVCVFDGMFIEGDKFQVGLLATFKPNEHSLYVVDFIGDWALDEERE